MPEETFDTRRALVRGAAAGSLLALLGGTRLAGAQLGGDRTIVTAALEVERRLQVLYDGASESGSLGVDERGLVRRFAEQQREHVDVLAAALGQRPAGGGGGQDARGGDVLRAAARLEEEALRTYFDAHQRLADAGLVKIGAGIMANHGQRLVALRDALGEEPVPDAFAGLGQAS